MTNLVTCLHSVIMTIPGIGSINGRMILGKIGDIHRFSTPGKLLAFAGLDPSVYQSENFQVKRTHMSKRGSRALRYALMAAVHNVVKNNTTFKVYYDTNRYCADKLVRVIWQMLTDEVEFNLKLEVSIPISIDLKKCTQPGVLFKLSFLPSIRK